MEREIIIDYYTDVLCVWAWIAQRRIDELDEQFGDTIKWRYHYVDIFGDTAGIFDQLDFNSAEDAGEALRRNGFSRYEEDKEAQEFIAKPEPSFRRRSHPDGPIYSSGRYWQ